MFFNCWGIFMMFSTSTSLSAFKKQAGEEKETGEERETGDE